jgi:ABC-type branched-subunit amino acid transport system ATPase component
MLVSIVVVGGLGNPRGVVVGAALVGCSLEVIRRGLTSWGLPQDTRFLIFSVALILFVHLRSKGIFEDRPSWLQGPESTGPIITTTSPILSMVKSEANQLLNVNNISKSFAGVVALDGFSLSLAAGECVALIGPNGSGKSTLLNCISGLIRADRGEIRLDGHLITSKAPHLIARAGIGRTFQELSVFDDISLRDNVYLPTRQVSAQQVDEVLLRFGLPNGGTLTDSLSYGSKKALDLARLFVQPDRLRVALLDEPTAGLTQREARDVVNTLSHFRATTGLATLIVSHDVMFLEALKVDRVVVLHRGKLFKQGNFADIRRDSDVRTLFWGNEELRPDAIAT